MTMRRWLFYVAPLLLWMLLIFALSAQPGTSKEQDTGPLAVRLLNALEPGTGDGLSQETIDRLNQVLRKLAHISEFGILTLLALRAYRGILGDRWPKIMTLTFLTVVLYAISDEWHQMFVPDRAAMVQDIVVDSFGASLILLVVLLWRADRMLERRFLGDPKVKGVKTNGA